MKLVVFLISPMLCDFSHFYRHNPDFVTPETPRQNHKLEGMTLMVHLEMLNRLGQEVENLSGRHHGTVTHIRRKTKLAEPFRPTNSPRHKKGNLIII